VLGHKKKHPAFPCPTAGTARKDGRTIVGPASQQILRCAPRASGNMLDASQDAQRVCWKTRKQKKKERKRRRKNRHILRPTSPVLAQAHAGFQAGIPTSSKHITSSLDLLLTRRFPTARCHLRVRRRRRVSDLPHAVLCPPQERFRRHQGPPLQDCRHVHLQDWQARSRQGPPCRH
jgi:hypothetical protein